MFTENITVLLKNKKKEKKNQGKNYLWTEYILLCDFPNQSNFGILFKKMTYDA